MSQVSSTITIHASRDAIWQVISDFGAADQYLSGVVDCTVEGDGVGALRMLTSADGSTIIERLETLDELAYRLSYSLLTDTPFRNCLTTVTIREWAPNQAELEWSATFEAAGIPTSEAVEMMESVLSANCLTLKQFVDASQ